MLKKKKKMKKFNQIENFKTISCVAKVSTDELKELHYQANDVIFSYNMQFAFPKNVEQAIKQLTEVFVKIKNLEVKDSALDKKNEILTKGRTIVQTLKDYINNFKYDDSCVAAIESMCKFQLSNYLKAKDSLTIQSGVELLEKNTVLREIAKDVANNLNIQPKINPFLKMQEEIVEILSKQLQNFSFKQRN